MADQTITQRAITLQTQLSTLDNQFRDNASAYPRVSVAQSRYDELNGYSDDALALSRAIRARGDARSGPIADGLEVAAVELARDAGSLRIMRDNGMTYGDNWNEQGPLAAVRDAVNYLTAGTP